jgi:hypothetical protein
MRILIDQPRVDALISELLDISPDRGKAERLSTEQEREGQSHAAGHQILHIWM